MAIIQDGSREWELILRGEKREGEGEERGWREGGWEESGGEGRRVTEERIEEGNRGGEGVRGSVRKGEGEKRGEGGKE